jgi:pimeloyl-ACP methyl ester carboxylesterase
VGLGAASPSVSSHVPDLLEVIGDDRAVVIGHSFGGLVALAGAALAPERILAVGVYEPPMPWLPFWPTDARPERDPATAAERFFHRVVGGGVWESVSSEFRAARRAEGPALVSDFAAAEAGLPFEFADILSPVAAAAGTASSDWYREAARTIAAGVHGATYTEIAGAGHGVHLSHPDAFAAWIATVADGVDR